MEPVQPLPPAGWYPSEPGVERWWDGVQWTDAVRPVQPAPSYYVQPPVFVGPSVMVTKSPKQTSHTFHLIMSLLTCGAWAVFVWLPVTIYNSLKRDKSVTRLR